MTPEELEAKLAYLVQRHDNAVRTLDPLAEQEQWKASMQHAQNQAQNYNQLAGYQQSQANSSFMGPVGHGLLSSHSPNWSGTAHAYPGYPFNVEPAFSTRPIMERIKKDLPELHDFVAATCSLMEVELQIAASPLEQTQSLHCAPKLIYRLISHKWLTDIQWVGDYHGNDPYSTCDMGVPAMKDEDFWVTKFARLAKQIEYKRDVMKEPAPVNQSINTAAAAAAIAQAQLILAQQMSHLGQSVAAGHLLMGAAQQMGVGGAVGTAGCTGATLTPAEAQIFWGQP